MILTTTRLLIIHIYWVTSFFFNNKSMCYVHICKIILYCPHFTFIVINCSHFDKTWNFCENYKTSKISQIKMYNLQSANLRSVNKKINTIFKRLLYVSLFCHFCRIFGFCKKFGLLLTLHFNSIPTGKKIKI